MNKLYSEVQLILEIEGLRETATFLIQPPYQRKYTVTNWKKDNMYADLIDKARGDMSPDSTHDDLLKAAGHSHMKELAKKHGGEFSISDEGHPTINYPHPFKAIKAEEEMKNIADFDAEKVESAPEE